MRGLYLSVPKRYVLLSKPSNREIHSGGNRYCGVRLDRAYSNIELFRYMG